MRIRIIVVALALLLCTIALPVGAWTLLDEMPQADHFHNTNNLWNYLSFSNISYMSGITRVTGEDIDCARRVAGTISVTATDEPYQFGSLSACTNGGVMNGHWEATADVAGHQLCHFDLTFSNMTAPTEKGACADQTIKWTHGDLFYQYFTIYTDNDNWLIENNITHPYWFSTSTGGRFNSSSGKTTTYGGTAMEAPVANFTCTPTEGPTQLMVQCTDSSTGPATSWNWSGSGGSMFWNTPTSQNPSILLPNAGNYTITLEVTNALGSSNLTRADYIWAYNSTSTATLYVTAINSLNGYPIHGAQVDLYDVQNTTWSNTTTTDGTGSITALLGHTINAYASATGFDDNDKLSIPIENAWESILLFPTGLKNVTAGNITLYVQVYDSANHALPIKNAAITVVSPTQSWGGYTNEGGTVSFTVPNQTTVLIDAKATGQGYQGATQTTSTGTGSGASASVTATFYLVKKTVTPTATVTTLPGGGTPTPTTTILPGCEDPTSPECQASQNNYSMAWLSNNALLLIQMAFIFTLLYMAGWKP